MNAPSQQLFQTQAPCSHCSRAVHAWYTNFTHISFPLRSRKPAALPQTTTRTVAADRYCCFGALRFLDAAPRAWGVPPF